LSEIHAVTVPRWGLSMEEGTILEWHVAEGGDVAPGAELVDIETTKITNTVEAQNRGKLRRILGQPGQTLPCGQLIGVIADAGASDAEIESFIENHKHDAGTAAEGATAKPEPSFVEIGGRRIRFLEQGSGGVPALFVHGFGGDLENWMFNQPAVAATRRTIAVDLPGHGGSGKAVGDGSPESFAAVLAGLLDALKIERVHIIAHSFGAAVSLALRQVQPERVASMTAIGPMGFGPEINAAYTGGFIAARRRSEVSAAIRLLFADESLATAEMAENLLRYKRLDGVAAALEAIADTNFADGAQRPVPPEAWETLGDRLLVVWGAEDRIIPSAQMDAVPAAAARSLIEGAGHMPHLEKAETVNALIARHLERVDA
jgi:pyruvate dehydrogenase E2 component (dihydrolipoamide acetyltransferase)